MHKKLVYPNVPVLTICQIKNSNPVVVDIAASSVTGGGLLPPHWHVDQNASEKYHIFSTSETVLCSGIG